VFPEGRARVWAACTEVHRGGRLLAVVVGGGAAFGGRVVLTIGGRWYILRVVLQNTMRGTWRSWRSLSR
jgi:hypothetical protein